MINNNSINTPADPLEFLSFKADTPISAAAVGSEAIPVQPAVNDGSQPQVTSVTQLANLTLGECDAVIKSLTDKINGQISEELQACRVQVQGCQACVNGAIQSALDVAARAVAKADAKITAKISAAQNEMIGNAMMAGMPPPSEEDIAAVQAGSPLNSLQVATDKIQAIANAPSTIDVNQAVSDIMTAVNTTDTTSGTDTVCPGGSVYDPNIGACVTNPPPPICPSGQTYNPNTGLCETIIPQQPPQPPPPNPPPQPPQTPPGSPTWPTGNPGTGNPPDCSTAQTVQVDCTTYPAIIPQHQWWVLQCAGNQVILCRYIGPFPPTPPPGGHVFGPDIPPDDKTVQGYQEQCGIAACSVAGVPGAPPPPPPPPPPAPPPQPSPPPVAGPPSPSLGSNFCDTNKTADTLKSVDQFTTTLTSGKTEIDKIISGSFGIDPNQTIGITSFLSDPVGTIAKVGAGVLSVIPSLINNLISSASVVSNNCDINAMSYMSLVRGIGSMFGNWGGMVPEALTFGNTYALNAKCPYLIPSTQDANGLYVRGFIDSDQWSLLTRSNGDCVDWQKIVRDALKTRPDIIQTISLWKRDKITDDDIDDRLIKLGITDKQQRDEFIELAKYIPGPGDLVQFMTRDVEDDAVVTKYQLDDEFDKKYTGKVQEWGNAQGMDDETFKRYWRQHWHMPSDGQLFDMLHRLRPDDRDDKDPNKDLIVSKQDVLDAVKVNDYMPYWVDKLVATSYRPLSRVDVRRMYETDVIDKDGVRRSYRDQGYDALNAGRLADFVERISGPKRAAYKGFPTEKETLDYYRNSVVDRTTAQGILQQLGIPDDSIQNKLDLVEFKVKNDLRKSVLSSYKKRYMTGEFDDGEIKSALSSVGWDSSLLDTIVQNWSYERQAKYKAPTVGMLCEWYTRGYISIDDYESRVRNLGYSVQDAARIVQSCVMKNAEKLAKEAQALADKAAAEARKKKKAQLQAAKDAFPCKPATKPTCPPGVQPPDPATVA